MVWKLVDSIGAEACGCQCWCCWADAGLVLRRVLGLFWDYSGSGIDLSCRDEEA